MLEQIYGEDIFRVIVVLSRLGALLMLLPGIGETYVSVPSRLALALVLSVLLTPPLLPYLPAAPDNVSALFDILAGEFLVGLLLGTLARAILSAMAVCGSVIAFSTGFSNAFLFNPALNDQGVLQAVFFTLLGVLMIFVTNTHHLFFYAIVDSYQTFTPGAVLSVGSQTLADMANAVSRVTADAFSLGVRLAAPLIVVVLSTYVLMAVLSRVMPQLQVFFVVMPLQILLGIFVTMLVIGRIMIVFSRSMQDLVGSLQVF